MVLVCPRANILFIGWVKVISGIKKKNGSQAEVGIKNGRYQVADTKSPVLAGDLVQQKDKLDKGSANN